MREHRIMGWWLPSWGIGLRVFSVRPFFITWVFLRIRGVLKKKTPRIPKKLTL